eukprot:1468632-Amphidinium_carterae.1
MVTSEQSKNGTILTLGKYCLAAGTFHVQGPHHGTVCQGIHHHLVARRSANSFKPSKIGGTPFRQELDIATHTG